MNESRNVEFILVVGRQHFENRVGNMKPYFTNVFSSIYIYQQLQTSYSYIALCFIGNRKILYEKAQQNLTIHLQINRCNLGPRTPLCTRKTYAHAVTHRMHVRMHAKMHLSTLMPPPPILSHTQIHARTYMHSLTPTHLHVRLQIDTCARTNMITYQTNN